MLLEGLTNSKKLANEDDQMECRFMDELFAIEETVAQVGSVCSLTYEPESELLPQVKETEEEKAAREAALLEKKKAAAEAAKAGRSEERR